MGYDLIDKENLLNRLLSVRQVLILDSLHSFTFLVVLP